MDLDDVLIKSSYLDQNGKVVFYWSENMEKDIGISMDCISVLAQDWDGVITGKKSVYEHVEMFLQKINSNMTSNEFIDYWMNYDIQLNKDVTDWTVNMHQIGHKLYIATNQENTRVERILKKHPDFFKIFDSVFTSADFGTKKTEPVFFTKVLEILNISSSDLLFIDDSDDNIASAQRVGIKSIKYNPKIFSKRHYPYLTC
ncbi:MAG: HAD-IA family hydrolase [Bacteroidales bacterium]|nr:HAD-IA family hydrolase [Bacteroidales bacterium]